MIRLLADENFNGKIVRGLLQRNPGLDIVRAQDVGLTRAEDPIVLEWAAVEGRIVLTHDVSTMPDFAYERIGRGVPTAGVVVIGDDIPVGRGVEEILILLECSREGEFENRVHYLPM